MPSKAFPIARAVGIDPSAEIGLGANRDLAALHRHRGTADPSRARIRGIAPHARVDDPPEGVHEADLVPVIGEPEDAALQPTRVALVEREVRGGEGVLRVARRIARDHEPTARGDRRVGWEHRGRLSIGEGPSGQIDLEEGRVRDLDELIVPRCVRVDT